MSLEGWRLSLDRGGTFTDVVAHGPHGEVRSAKVLARTGDGLDAIAHVLSERERGDLSLRVGTTVATNALLTGTGAPTALMITRGFRDLPLIGHQARPDIFALDVVRPDWPIGWVVEVDERLRSDGFEERGVDDVSVREALAGLLREGCSALAVCLAHGVAYPQHELAVEQIARGMGFREVVVSHRVSRRDGLVDRAHASCLDASLTPSVQAFVRSVSRVAPSVRAHFMASDGGLVGPSRFRGRRALLSGPAGGVAACARLARAMGVEQVLGFDMGGTSTDVCRWAGRTEQREHSQLAGMSVPLPGVDVVSVAAGGGSRLTLCDGRAQVGPGSVGADPGPACYGLGSAAAVTDANLVLGRIQASRFPTVFGERGDQPLSMERARRAIASAAGVAAEDLAAVRAAAAGFLTVADEAMGEAIACLSVSRGHDPREHALVALGGAGPQHACSVAELLGVRRVLVHPRAGVLSAWGIAGAPSVATAEARVDRDWAETLPAELEDVVQELVERVTRELEDEGITRELRIETRYDLRYSGSQTTLRVRERSAFEDEHRRLFGFARPGGRIEVLRVVVQAWVETPVVPWMPPAPARPPLPTEFVPLLVPREGRAIEVEAALHSWEKLGAGQEVVGPALVTGAETTFVLDPGWTCTVWDGGTLDCRHTAGVAPAPRLPEAPDPVGLELFSRRFMGVAERMGETLRRVAWSTNIRERLDFSCAVFDAEGHLLANAPHIPVHLGAMGETVRALRAGLDDGALRPGRSWAVNDPQMGGSHLPDITVVTPVYDGPRVFAWVASRGHHADVGGITPGSMPPFSTSLAEEGVLLRALLLVDGQEWQREQIAAALAAGPYPVRDPATVQADLQAQVAANQVGVHALQELRARCGAESLSRWMGWVLDNGEAVLQDWLESLPDGPLTCADAMDDGTAVVVGLTPLGTAGERRLRVDFTGTGPASSGNLNAPKAVVRAALLYVLRCAMGREIPLNDGVLRGVDLEIPANSLLAPPAGAAVVGGNVETSQRVVDVLLGALGLAAASQGTMNNLCFGTSSTAYYETIAGGAGGTATAPGASCVQTHMTNTRITDPEVLERRFPVLVEEFSRRRGSGGTGRRSGGDGVQRVLRFLEPVQVSLLSQRRSLAPGGLRGGGPGLPGEAARIRGGLSESLPGCFAEEFEAGDVLVVGTPGGGAYGAVDAEDL